MKKILLSLIALCISAFAFAQTNISGPATIDYDLGAAIKIKNWNRFGSSNGGHMPYWGMNIEHTANGWNSFHTSLRGSLILNGGNAISFASAPANTNNATPSIHMTLNTITGNVGIGTTSPNGLLDVRGNIKLGDIKDSYLGVNTINNYVPYTSTYNSVVNSGKDLYFNIDANNNDTNRAFIFASDRNGESGGTELMRILESGNVGIGTTSPNALLDIKKSTSSTSEIIRFTDGNYKLGDIKSLGSSDGYGLYISGRTEGGSNPTPALTMAGYANDITPDNGYDAAVSIRGYDITDGSKLNHMPIFKVMNSHTDIHLTVEANGNVGIGSTSPLDKFQVSDGVISNQQNIVSNGVYTILNARSNRTVDDYGGLNSEYFKMNLITEGPTTTGGTSEHRRADLRFALRNTIDDVFSDRLTIKSNGNVGIGTTSPTEKLSVDGNILIYHPDDQYYGSPSALTLLNNALVFKHQHGNKNAEIRGAISPGKHTTGLVFRTKSSYDQSLENRMIIHPDGNVGIGTISPTEKLSVDGTVLAKKVRVSVAAADWPDYIFAPNSELRALSELETYIIQNQHLPEVPSAKEVETNGLDLGSMDATLLKKVEELTLYLIQENKDKEALRKENVILKNTLEEVLKRLEKLEKG